MAAIEGLLDIPAAWKAIQPAELQGVLMVVGAPDAGKSTFARYLFQLLRSHGQKVAYLDGDPGQSALGPPTTLTLAYGISGNDEPFPAGLARRYFVGSTTPQGHMLPTLVGAARLVEAARQEGVRSIVYDTSGLVDPGQGGLALKSAKIDLLRPAVIFALQREQELEPLLLPLRRSQRTRVIDLRPSAAAVSRLSTTRREYRARQFARYFAGARRVELGWTKVAVLPLPVFRLHRLAALEGQDGFTLALGIVLEIDRASRQVTLLTPLHSLAGVNALRLGDVLLDPDTFEDERISR